MPSPSPLRNPAFVAKFQSLIGYFKEYLSKCPEHEIRCLWFLGGDPKVGMVMTLDLKLYSVYTVRDVLRLGTSVPSMVRRLYDLGGGGVDCRFDDSKPKSDKVAPKQAAIRPLPK